MNYRTHIALRRQGIAPFNSFEQQTEQQGSDVEEYIEKMGEEYKDWLRENITADTILLEDEGEDADD